MRSSRSRRHDWRGLSPNTTYDVRVRAVSAAGKGKWSDVVQVTTPGGIQQTKYVIILLFFNYETITWLTSTVVPHFTLKYYYTRAQAPEGSYTF